MNSIENFNIVDLFTTAVENYPDRIAIIDKQEQVSFTGLNKNVTHTAQYFISKGISKGDKILVFVPMSIDLYRIVLAIFKIGAIAVFLDEWVSKKRMEECCKVAQCKAFVGIFKARALSFFSTELRKIPIKLGVHYKVLNSFAPFISTIKEDTALITFTTGTTGIPKAALRTHGFLFNQFEALKSKLNAEENDIAMVSLPVVLLINLATAVTSVIPDFKASKPELLYPKKLIRQIKKHSLNSLIASPFFIKKISEYLIKSNNIVPQIKKIFTGGAPVFPAEAAMYEEAFPSANITIVYGSTEAEPVSTINVKSLLSAKDYFEQGLPVGKIADCAEVKIIQIINDSLPRKTADELAKIEMPCNEIGEIIVSGNHVLRSYLNDEAGIKRNKIFIGDVCWHRTGDSGYLGEEKTLFLTGRCNTIIHKAGKIYYPFLFENYFQSIDGVETGIILLVKEKITAVIELKKNGEKNFVVNEIKKYDNLIESIVFLGKIPRDPRHNSKIEYQTLRSFLAEN